MEAARYISKKHSDNKWLSLSQSPLCDIGQFGESFMKEMKLNTIRYDPVMPLNNKVPITKHLGKKQAQEFLMKHKNPKVAFGGCSILDNEVYKQYVCDPFTKIHQDAVFCPLSFQPFKQLIDHNEVTPNILLPPHPITWTSFEVHPGNTSSGFYRLTGEIANEYLLALPILRILYAGVKNIPIGTTIAMDEPVNMINYLVCFHLGAESGYQSTWKVHGASVVFYHLWTDTRCGPHTEAQQY